MFGIKLAHDLPVAFDEILQTLAFAKEFVPIDWFELEGVALAFVPVTGATAAEIPGVVMQRKTVDIVKLARTFAEDFFEEAARPRAIVTVGTGRDERERAAVAWQPSGVTPEFNGIFLRGEISAAAPGFVADAPELDV